MERLGKKVTYGSEANKENKVEREKWNLKAMAAPFLLRSKCSKGTEEMDEPHGWVVGRDMPI